MQAIEIIKGRYYLAFLKQPDALQRSAIAASSVCYCIDNELVRLAIWDVSNHSLPVSQQRLLTLHPSLLQLYEPFYADFGPLNLGKTYRFCELTKRLLQVGICAVRQPAATLHTQLLHRGTPCLTQSRGWVGGWEGGGHARGGWDDKPPCTLQPINSGVSVPDTSLAAVLNPSDCAVHNADGVRRRRSSRESGCT